MYQLFKKKSVASVQDNGLPDPAKKNKTFDSPELESTVSIMKSKNNMSSGAIVNKIVFKSKKNGQPKRSEYCGRQLRDRTKINNNNYSSLQEDLLKVQKSSSKDTTKKQSELKKIQEAEEDYELKSNPPPLTYLRPSGRVSDWDNFLDLSNPNISTNLDCLPPVEYFKGAPLAKIWKTIAIPGLAVELRNPFVYDRDAYWLGTIIHFAGYRALVKFESFDDEDSDSTNYVSWMSFCSNVSKPLGFCKENGKELFPGPIVPKTVSAKQLELGLQRFYEKPTIPADLPARLCKEFNNLKTVSESVPIEVLDLVTLHKSRLARIATIQGDRVCVVFYNDDGELETKRELWLSYASDSLRPFGFSHTIGLELCGNPRDFRCNLLPPDSFPPWPSDKIKIEEGMRLEAKHPFIPWKIVQCVVVKVLKYGYFKFQTCDKSEALRTKFVQHVTSPFIFPVGFGSRYDIHVEHHEEASDKISPNLRLDLLPPRPPHQFSVGDKMETIDVVSSHFLGGATVVKIAGHMLYLHYDGWSKDVEKNFCWVDVEKSDIFPCGYSEMVSLDFDGNV